MTVTGWGHSCWSIFTLRNLGIILEKSVYGGNGHSKFPGLKLHMRDVNVIIHQFGYLQSAAVIRSTCRSRCVFRCLAQGSISAVFRNAWWLTVFKPNSHWKKLEQLTLESTPAWDIWPNATQFMCLRAQAECEDNYSCSAPALTSRDVIVFGFSAVLEPSSSICGNENKTRTFRRLTCWH